MTEENEAEPLAFLARHAIPYVCVDMPQGLRDSIPPVLAVTADVAVVRFHGHWQKWNSRNIYDRFGYLYSEDELHEWAPKLGDLAQRADVLHVVMNNCYRDYAQRNAGQLMHLLTGQDAEPDVP